MISYYCCDVVGTETVRISVFADRGPARLERAFELVTATEPIRRRIRDADITNWHAAAEAGIITTMEAEQMAAMQNAIDQVSAVDDFAAEELMRR